MQKIIFLGVFLSIVVTFFELKMCMYCHSLTLFFPHQQVQFFVFLSEFNHYIFPQGCHESIQKVLLNKNLDNLICGNFLPELTPLLVR